MTNILEELMLIDTMEPCKVVDLTAAYHAHDDENGEYPFETCVNWVKLLKKDKCDYALLNGKFYEISKWGLGEEVQASLVAPHGRQYTCIQYAA